MERIVAGTDQRLNALHVSRNLGQVCCRLSPQVAKLPLGLTEAGRQFLADDSHSTPCLPLAFDEPRFCRGDAPAFARPDRVGSPLAVSLRIQVDSRNDRDALRWQGRSPSPVVPEPVGIVLQQLLVR